MKSGTFKPLLTTGIIGEKKRFLENAVDRTIQMIEIERQRVIQESEATELSVNQINAKTKERIKELLHQIKLIDDGYIWVNRIVNYDGGDKYAVREIHPNLPETEGIWLSTETRDIKGNKPYQAELDGINKKGELFFEYYFKKLKSDKIAHKMSYAKLYKPFDWVVATGVYLDDVDKLIKNETKIMQTTYKNQLMFSIYAAFAAIVVSTLILFGFERQISRLIRHYESDINKYTHSLVAQKEKTEKALKEKETLLHEIHHRVKNNMTVISSLLRLQMDSIDNKIAREALQESQNRVQSMSMIHQTLYQSEDLSAINLKTYLSELGKNIMNNYSINNKVQFIIDVENIMIEVKQASTVGLIVNELITNCLKYSFPDYREGEIVLRLKSNNENEVDLRLSDNGIGMPVGFDWKNSDTLGLQLVRTLVEQQLNGTVEVDSINGATFTIKFYREFKEKL
ncbi:MAG: histidine kinase dimerization/phosphoacceptor domain -containing protein [Spirochaetia bacterium]|nr:histidine kinase dimerization/phosphoacceptor domain -containing protein [Spirochaetia bacterium]